MPDTVTDRPTVPFVGLKEMARLDTVPWFASACTTPLVSTMKRQLLSITGLERTLAPSAYVHCIFPTAAFMAYKLPDAEA